MRNIVHLFISCMLAAVTVTARSDDREYLLDGVAAIVNEHVITVGDVSSAAAPLQRRITAAPGTTAYDKEAKQLYMDSLEGLIEKFLILDSKEASQVQIPEWYVDRRIKEIIEESFNGDEDKLRSVLARDRQTFAQWRDELKDHITVTSVRSFKIENNVSVSPNEVREFYRRERDRFVVPGKVKVSMIVLEQGDDVDDPAVLARMLKKRIDDGEDFGALAGKYSKGTYAEQGGDWGWTDPAILRQELREALDTMKAGETEVITVGSQVYVMRVDERKDAIARDFSEVQPIVERLLKRRKAEEDTKSWIALLKKKAYIKVSDPDTK